MKFKLLSFVFAVAVFPVTSVMAQGVSEADIRVVEDKIEKAEEMIKTLTSQIEENEYKRKKDAANQDTKMTATVWDIKSEVEKIGTNLKEYSEEIVKLRNRNNEMSQQIENLKSDFAKMDEFIKTIPTKDPKSLMDGKSDMKIESDISEELLLLSKAPVDAENKKEDGESSINEVQEYDAYKQALSLYKDKNYTESAIGFADIMKKYPEGKNFHSSLFYLGKSMQKLGKVNNSCQAFANIINSKEVIDAKIKNESIAEFEKLDCKNLNNKNGKK